MFLDIKVLLMKNLLVVFVLRSLNTCVYSRGQFFNVDCTHLRTMRIMEIDGVHKSQFLNSHTTQRYLMDLK
jgi:hypothetical protein